MWAVVLELEELVWALYESENGLEERIGEIANVSEHIDIFDKPLTGQFEEAESRHG